MPICAAPGARSPEPVSAGVLIAAFIVARAGARDERDDQQRCDERGDPNTWLMHVSPS